MGQLSGFMINVRLAEMRSACCPSTQDVGFETLRLGKLQPAVGAIGTLMLHTGDSAADQFLQDQRPSTPS